MAVVPFQSALRQVRTPCVIGAAAVAACCCSGAGVEPVQSPLMSQLPLWKPRSRRAENGVVVLPAAAGPHFVLSPVCVCVSVCVCVCSGGCTFDEDSDASLCDYRQGQEDDFDWQLIRTYSWPHATPDLLRGSFMMVNASQHYAGQRAQMLLRPLSENDTHCIQFSYFLYSRDGHSPGALNVFIRVNGGPQGSAVWNISGSQGRQWHQVELAVSTFWPSEYQVTTASILCVMTMRMKCCKYWPDDSEMYGDIKITLLKTETLAEYTVRTFVMERRGYPAKHEVCQFHFTSWPEHGVPYHATGLLAFLRRVKASTPADAGPVVVHCSMGAGRTGCYIVLDVMLDMAECEGVVDIYNCVKTLCSRRINMIQTEEQYVFIHDAILEACLCGETAIPVNEYALTYTEMLKVDSQSNTSQLREEFQTLNSVTPHLDVEECSVSLMPRNREKNRSMDVLPPDRALAFLVAGEGEGGDYINAALTDSFLRPAAFVVTPHPLPGTTGDFWRLVYDYGCTAVVMLNQLNQSNSAWPCLQYWPEPGLQQFGPMTVELLSRTADDDVIIRLFRVQNIMRDGRLKQTDGPEQEESGRGPPKLQEGQLVVRHFQFLRWSPYRDVPDSKKAFISLLAQVHNWQLECGEGRTIVHCLNGGGRSGTFCACTMILEMIRHHSVVDAFFAAKTLRNSKPNMVETMEQYRFCYELALEYLDCLEVR
ncbi:receptor-type tyrosine-protein phosphatase U [Gadus macrocephalus]|uniref:receptor-type tyrosine-protein phosphatase U n=1 Tax=Gadus macrocephalus TaxID=80720 RepID=UPI0028CBB6C2|nr:receptor-type tyrosine-protein phosphatase U [Gadus macrocephalus]